MTPEEFNNLKAKADMLDADSEYNLGVCYSQGEVVPKDDVEAAFWYGFAANQGHTKAQYEYGICNFFGRGRLKNKSIGMYWIKQAANKGSNAALFQLSRFYYHGNGVPKDEVKGDYYRSLLRQDIEAKEGDMYAQHKLAARYWTGEYAQVDRVEAYALFTLASVSIEDARESRDRLEKEMSPEDIIRGQQRTKELQKEIEERQKAKEAGK